MSFEASVTDMGITSGDQIDIIWERKPPSNLSRIGWYRGLTKDDQGPDIKDPRVNRVACVGRDIVRSARKYIREKLDVALKNKEEEMVQLAQAENREISKQEAYKAIIEDPEVQKWTESFERIEGYTHDGIKNWQCKSHSKRVDLILWDQVLIVGRLLTHIILPVILLHTPIPNAFVSEMLPQRVFVTTGLFDQFISTDDELAMIMGHE